MEGLTPVDMLLVEDNPADVYLVQRAVARYSPAIRLTALFQGRETLEFLRKEPPFGNNLSPLGEIIPHLWSSILRAVRLLALPHHFPDRFDLSDGAYKEVH
jgi:hypothetical protein